MSDESVEALLDSDEALVAVEAPAGCGKTYQGAKYAQRAASQLGKGRVLILTHTHAACSVFSSETRHEAARVEIRTIDSLITSIAAAYHKSLGVPPDPASWARRQGSDGFEKLGLGVAALMKAHPMIGGTLSERYPIVIGDEHQDSSAAQHAIIMAFRDGGSRLRLFGDPMQHIYGSRGDAARSANRARWDDLRNTAACDDLDTPHRWTPGSPELGELILQAREALKQDQPVDLRGDLPQGLRILYAENIAPNNSGYRIDRSDRQGIDQLVNTNQPLLILTGQNDTVRALRAMWGRRIPIWEGHVRNDLGALVTAVATETGNAAAIGEAVVEFVSAVGVGFSPSSHGNVLLQEIRQDCSRRTRGKPARVQELARCILERPDHVGVAKCLQGLAKLIADGTAGFERIALDNRREFRDAIRLGEFGDAEEGMKEIHRRRSFARPVPPDRAISTIHKAKGLQCENAIVLPCDRRRFGGSDYARCKLYVALSRARCSLTLVLSRRDSSSLFILPSSV